MQHGIITQTELISAEKYFHSCYSDDFNKEFMFLPHILLIMCHNPCHTSYALYYHNGEFWLLIWNWLINLVETVIGCFATYNSISSCLNNEVTNCSIINDLILISVDRVIFKEKLLRRLKSIWSSLFIVSTFPQIISRKSVGHFFMMDASLIC